MSNLRDIPDEIVGRLLTGSTRVRIPAGSVILREGNSPAHFELVVSGLVRVFVSSPDGRTMTVRYCRTGALIGAMSLFLSPFALPATVQALVDAETLRFSPTIAQRVGTSDLRAARAFLHELAERAQGFAAELSGSAFATVRQRVARHLLDLAADSVSEEHRSGPTELVAAVSQRDLAEAVGTVREVVVRVLRELRSEEIVRTGRDRIVIVDPDRLIKEQAWNPGS